MAFIFASNPDSLAGQKNYYDQSNIRLAENDQRARQAMIDEQNRQALRNQELMRADAMQAQQAQLAAAQNAFNFQQNQMVRQDDKADRAFKFGIDRADRAAENKEQRRQFDVGSDLKKTQLADSKAQGDYVELVNAIGDNSITSPSQIDALFGHLSKPDLDRAKVYFHSKQQGLNDEYQAVNNAAQAATAQVVAKAVPATDNTHTILRFLPSNAKPAVPSPRLTEQEAMKKLIDVPKNPLLKNYMDLIQWDEGAQQFVPIIKKPQGFTFAAPSPPTATAPSPLPSPAVSADSFSFTNAPPAAVSQPPIVWPPGAGSAPNQLVAQRNQGYRVGAMYKGGLVYLGGDPNSPASWKQAGQ